MPPGITLMGEKQLYFSKGIFETLNLSEDSSDSETEHGSSFSKNSKINESSHNYFSSNTRRPSDSDDNETKDKCFEPAMEKIQDNDDSNQRQTKDLPSLDENTTINESSNDHFPSKKRRRSDSADKNGTDEKSLEPPSKKVSDIGKKLMQKMGYSEGKGLGKYGQGRLQPVEASDQKGRRGLGHNNIKLKEAARKWNPSKDLATVQERMEWLENDKDMPLNNKLNDWMVLGQNKTTIDDEILFCDENILHQILDAKSIFNNLDKNEMRRARSRSNPYETIRSAFFQNRAAVKMANIDRACNFIFTDFNRWYPKETLHFADVCAGPGGFSEYVLWKKKWHAKGYGFTLRGSNDFKLDEFHAGSPENFHTFYGPKNDGNVYDPSNQEAFKQLIMKETQGKGVHFMMSDGGFSVDGNENIQEISSKQLYLCQCLVALMIVREKGNFVTKLFDIFTPFSAGLIYLMYRCFKHICIFKPNTSRPANSERYLICNEKLPNIDNVIDYLRRANEILLKNNGDCDVIELVPYEVLCNDEIFFQYLKGSNESLGKKQIMGLSKIAAYYENPKLIETRQSQMRQECLKHWELPDQIRKKLRNVRPEDRIQTLLLGLNPKNLIHPPKEMILEMNDILNPPCDWYCVPSVYDKSSSSNTENGPSIYFGMGRTKVFQLVNDTWKTVRNVELPPDTLVYAEMVTEYRGEHKVQRKTTALHIIDAWFLGGDDISRKYLPERKILINKFCNALWKPDNNVSNRVRSREIHSLDVDLTSKLKLEKRKLKTGPIVWAHHPREVFYSQNSEDNEKPYFFIPYSIIFLKSTLSPFSLHLSRSTGLHYFFNSKTNNKFYPDRMVPECISTFFDTFKTRVFMDLSDNQVANIQCLNNKVKKICPGVSNSTHKK